MKRSPSSAGGGHLPDRSPRAVTPRHGPARQFELLDLVGRGGMADVFRARLRGAVGFERIVALKMLRSDLADDATQRERLAGEARLLSVMDHPTIVQVLDYLEVGGRSTIVLEYVRGPDLRLLLERVARARIALAPALAAGIAYEVAAALAHAAEVRPGFVHGDVSPGNVLVARSGAVKLIDFGVATTTPDATIRGKPAYLAPEHVLGGVPDARSDIFSLAIVLWEALTRRRLFKQEDDARTLLAVRDVRIEERMARHDDVPAGLLGIIGKALARAPEDRFQSAAELAHALGDWLAASGTSPLLASARAALVARLFPPGEAQPIAEDTGPVFTTPDLREPPPLPSASLDLSVLEDTIADLEAQPESRAFVALALGRATDPRAALVKAGAGFAPLGQLDPLGLVAVVMALALQHRSGALTLADGARRKIVYLADGLVVHVDSNIEAELLGRQLTSTGVISTTTAESALALARASGVRLGQALVDLQAATPESLAAALREQLRSRFADLLTWGDARASFEPGRAPRRCDTPPDAALDPLPLVVATLRDSWPEARLQRLLGPLAVAAPGPLVHAASPSAAALDRLALTPAERAALEELRATSAHDPERGSAAVPREASGVSRAAGVRSESVAHILARGRTAAFALLVAFEAGLLRASA